MNGRFGNDIQELSGSRAQARTRVCAVGYWSNRLIARWRQRRIVAAPTRHIRVHLRRRQLERLRERSARGCAAERIGVRGKRHGRRTQHSARTSTRPMQCEPSKAPSRSTAGLCAQFSWTSQSPAAGRCGDDAAHVAAATGCAEVEAAESDAVYKRPGRMWPILAHPKCCAHQFCGASAPASASEVYASTRRSASATLDAIGFSEITCLPATAAGLGSMHGFSEITCCGGHRRAQCCACVVLGLTPWIDGEFVAQAM